MSLERASGTVSSSISSSNATSFGSVLGHRDRYWWYWGLISGGFCLLGTCDCSGMMMKNGSRIVRPVIITVLALLFIKVISDIDGGLTAGKGRFYYE